MATLQEIKKQRGLTNAQVGIALGKSAGVAGMILQGRHIRVLHDTEIAELADVLGITFERCWLAMLESYNQFRGTPGVERQRADEVRASVQVAYGFPVETPRPMAMVDSYPGGVEIYHG